MILYKGMPIFRRYNKDFFKVWSSDMSYVLGFFAADGNIIKTKRGTHFISFNSSDRDILKRIHDVMESEHKISTRISPTGQVHRFQIGSKSMYEDLLGLGFSDRKSNRMIMPKIPERCFPDFVRGYFDGDGNVWVGELNKSRKKPTKAIQASFTSGSRIFLEGLLIRLKVVKVKGGAIYTSKVKNFSRLQLSTLDALKLYEIMYNGQPKLYLKRKKLRFDMFKSKRDKTR